MQNSDGVFPNRVQAFIERPQTESKLEEKYFQSVTRVAALTQLMERPETTLRCASADVDRSHGLCCRFDSTHGEGRDYTLVRKHRCRQAPRAVTQDRQGCSLGNSIAEAPHSIQSPCYLFTLGSQQRLREVVRKLSLGSFKRNHIVSKAMLSYLFRGIKNGKYVLVHDRHHGNSQGL